MEKAGRLRGLAHRIVRKTGQRECHSTFFCPVFL